MTPPTQDRKPPREWYEIHDRDGRIVSSTRFDSLESAEAEADEIGFKGTADRIVKVREVTAPQPAEGSEFCKLCAPIATENDEMIEALTKADAIIHSCLYGTKAAHPTAPAISAEANKAVQRYMDALDVRNVPRVTNEELLIIASVAIQKLQDALDALTAGKKGET